jgi:tyrosinase
MFMTMSLCSRWFTPALLALFALGGCLPHFNIPRESFMQAPPNKIIPEMLGATSHPFQLQTGRTDVSIPMHKPSGPALLRSKDGKYLIRPNGTPVRFLLKFEAITSDAPSPTLHVYLNLPEGEPPQKHPERFAGLLPMFGLVESSQTGENHPDDGLHHAIDITALFAYLGRQKNWDSESLRITIIPEQPTSFHPRVGRVSLYIV